eukprot:1549496-Rhodomonas_salina.1
MSRVHRLLAELEDAKEQVRVDAARELKEVVAMTGEGRGYVQEALVALCRPALDTSDEAKKNAVEYLIKVVDSPDDCSTCSEPPAPQAFISHSPCFASSSSHAPPRATLCAPRSLTRLALLRQAQPLQAHAMVAP